MPDSQALSGSLIGMGFIRLIQKKISIMPILIFKKDISKDYITKNMDH